MIFIINTNGSRLCGDNRWRNFAMFGSFHSCVKTYKTVSGAKRTAKRLKGKVVEIPSSDDVRRSVDASGNVIEAVDSPDKPGYERFTHRKLDEFVVFDGVQKRDTGYDDETN